MNNPEVLASLFDDDFDDFDARLVTKPEPAKPAAKPEPAKPAAKPVAPEPVTKGLDGDTIAFIWLIVFMIAMQFLT